MWPRLISRGMQEWARRSYPRQACFNVAAADQPRNAQADGEYRGASDCFNVAAADQPRNGPLGWLSASTSTSFNVAAADQPRNVCDAARPRIALRSFNVAAADQPRNVKGEVPSRGHQLASMWPRLISRGMIRSTDEDVTLSELQCGRG